MDYGARTAYSPSHDPSGFSQSSSNSHGMSVDGESLPHPASQPIKQELRGANGTAAVADRSLTPGEMSFKNGQSFGENPTRNCEAVLHNGSAFTQQMADNESSFLHQMAVAGSDAGQYGDAGGQDPGAAGGQMAGFASPYNTCSPDGALSQGSPPTGGGSRSETPQEGEKYDDIRKLKPDLPKPPKKPLTPYMGFSKAVWQQVKLCNPGLTVCQVGTTIGRLWRELTDTDKQKYNEFFLMDKTRYDTELKSYLAEHGLQPADLVKPRAKRTKKSDASTPASTTPSKQKKSATHSTSSDTPDGGLLPETGGGTELSGSLESLPHFAQLWNQPGGAGGPAGGADALQQQTHAENGGGYGFSGGGNLVRTELGDAGREGDGKGELSAEGYQANEQHQLLLQLQHLQQQQLLQQQQQQQHNQALQSQQQNMALQHQQNQTFQQQNQALLQQSQTLQQQQVLQQQQQGPQQPRQQGLVVYHIHADGTPECFFQNTAGVFDVPADPSAATPPALPPLQAVAPLGAANPWQPADVDAAALASLRGDLAEKCQEVNRLMEQLGEAYGLIRQLKQQNDFYHQHWASLMQQQGPPTAQGQSGQGQQGQPGQGQPGRGQGDDGSINQN